MHILITARERLYHIYHISWLISFWVILNSSKIWSIRKKRRMFTVNFSKNSHSWSWKAFLYFYRNILNLNKYNSKYLIHFTQIDYCISLTMLLLIQKLSNLYNLCIYKLIPFKVSYLLNAEEIMIMIYYYDNHFASICMDKFIHW